MSRHTAETLLISAIINSGDDSCGRDYGVLSHHFIGHRAEYAWVASYASRYHRTPAKQEFLAVFEDFTFNADQDDLSWPASEVKKQFSSRELSKALVQASAHLVAGRVEEAFLNFKGLEFATAVQRPSNLLIDHQFLDDYDVPEDKIPMPWKTLQAYTDGMGKGELWYLAARPGQGKTSDMLAIAAETVWSGRSVCMYSLEMTKRQVQTKMHALLARKMGLDVSEREMRARRYDALEYKRLMQQIESEVPGEMHIFTPKEGICTPAVVSSRAQDYDLNVIDYISLMRPEGGGRATDDWRVVAQLSNELKEIALAKDTRVLAASQINREGDNSSRPPKLKNLANSDALGQDGDVVVTMCRYGPGVSMFSLEKNRHGESFINWWSRFNPDVGDLSEICRDDADDIRDSEGM